MALLVRVLATLAVCAVTLGACGGSGATKPGAGASTTAGTASTGSGTTSTTAPGGAATATTPSTPKAKPAPSPFPLSRRVPRRSDGPADPVKAHVIRAWAQALQDGDIAKAASYWAIPSLVQNGTPVLELQKKADVLSFNSELPCGAVVTKARRAPGGFTITTVQLVDRAGADCGTGVGNLARVAIRVHRGKILEWYRLADPAPSVPGVQAA